VVNRQGASAKLSGDEADKLRWQFDHAVRKGDFFFKLSNNHRVIFAVIGFEKDCQVPYCGMRRLIILIKGTSVAQKKYF